MKLDQQYTQHAIRTYTGKAFDILILDPETICIEDIAHGLSHTARFAGHTNPMLTVAQHSIRVCHYVDQEHKLAALLHDASEAYLGDIPSPFKKLMPDYKYLESNLMWAIAEKYGFDFPLHPQIKEADRFELSQEWNAFMADDDYGKVLTPAEAKVAFIETFNQLTR